MDESMQQIYAELAARCTRVKEGKYIMSGNTIASLLRYISSQPVLMSRLEKCNYGFMYSSELETAMSGGIFKLPLGSRKVVALITGLLFELDRGTINFHNFIKKYYRASGVDTSFDMFVNSVIMPYLMAFKNVLADERILDDKGNVDPAKLDPVMYDTFQSGYYALGRKVGQAWDTGSKYN